MSKEIKRLKKSIVKETAINIGYSQKVLGVIPQYALIGAIKEIACTQSIDSDTQNAIIENMVVTESVKQMNYQDFKEIKDYFFNNINK